MSEHVFIGRQPLVDKQQKIFGYELLFRDSGHATTANIADDLEAGTRVLVNTLSNMGAEWLFGDKLAFINVAAQMLSSDFLELLPPQKVVLELIETVMPTEDLLVRVKDLRSKGYRFALDDFIPNQQNLPWLEVADYVKLDVQHIGASKVEQYIKILSKFPVKFIAEKVETHEEFNHCKNAGFDYYQGYYFAHPETLSTKVVTPDHTAVMQLLNLARENADIKDIETAFKRDVALSFKLLRYINSVGFGLSCEIQSIRHAVAILGYEQLYRWLTLLLVTAGASSTSPALMKTAVTRGRLTELLGEGLLEKQERDNLFIVGVFSLLDAMLEMPMEQVLDKLLLPESITDALLDRQGVYGPFLQLAEACEDEDSEKITEVAGLLSIKPEQVNKAHLSALAWVEHLGI